jgi:hypothetical protein
VGVIGLTILMRSRVDSVGMVSRSLSVVIAGIRRVPTTHRTLN